MTIDGITNGTMVENKSFQSFAKGYTISNSTSIISMILSIYDIRTTEISVMQTIVPMRLQHRMTSITKFTLVCIIRGRAFIEKLQKGYAVK